MPNPLRLDPGRTLSLRRNYILAFRRRLVDLAKSVVKYVDGDDSLGLKRSEVVRSLLTNAEGDAAKVVAFQKWFQEKVAEIVLGIDPVNPWLRTYIKDALQKGLTRGYEQVNRVKSAVQEPGLFAGTKGQWVQSTLRDNAVVDKLDMLAARSYSKLKGYMGELESEMVRILADSLAGEPVPREIAAAMFEKIKATDSKTLRLGNTEVMYAFTDGQLEAFEKLGIKEVSLLVEWKTAEDDGVCPECYRRSGTVMTIAEARGILPLHPNCRCIWVPYLR